MGYIARVIFQLQAHVVPVMVVTFFLLLIFMADCCIHSEFSYLLSRPVVLSVGSGSCLAKD